MQRVTWKEAHAHRTVNNGYSRNMRFEGRDWELWVTFPFTLCISEFCIFPMRIYLPMNYLWNCNRDVSV